MAESGAWETCQKDVASEVQTFRNGEIGARVALMNSEATASEQWDNSYSSATTIWMTSAAGAQSTFTTLATNAEVALQNGLLADYASYIGGVTSAFDGWVTTVSNGVASQYASYYGGGSDVTAVANAWRDYDQDEDFGGEEK